MRNETFPVCNGGPCPSSFGWDKKYLGGSATGLKSKAEISLKSYPNHKTPECPRAVLWSHPSSLSHGPFPLLACLCFGLLRRGTAPGRGARGLWPAAEGTLRDAGSSRPAPPCNKALLPSSTLNTSPLCK